MNSLNVIKQIQTTTMKDTSSFFCNLDYLLVPIKLCDLHNIIKKGVQIEQQPYKSCIEAEPLLPCKEQGVYAVAIFRQWKNRNMKDLGIDNIDPESDVALKIDKSAVLHIPFHFNKCENDGRQDNMNTLLSNEESSSTVWRYDAVRNLNNIIFNEVIFHKVLHPAFIKEIWYFTENTPPSNLYNRHYKARFVDNNKRILL